MFNVITYAAAVKKAKKLIEEYIHDIPVATDHSLGGVIVGENLDITPQGVLSVSTADTMTEADDRPITSAAVYAVVGDIERALAAI